MVMSIATCQEKFTHYSYQVNLFTTYYLATYVAFLNNNNVQYYVDEQPDYSVAIYSYL